VICFGPIQKTEKMTLISKKTHCWNCDNEMAPYLNNNDLTVGHICTCGAYTKLYLDGKKMGIKYYGVAGKESWVFGEK